VTIDLHSHSNQSDGILSPVALMSRAKMRGLAVIALTDHDTIAGLVEAQQAASELGLELVPGIEFSSQWNGRGVHILGLGVDPESDVLLEAISLQHQAREVRAQAIGQKLAKLGFPGALEGAQKLAGNAMVSRPHFARYLVEQGAVRSVQMAFKRYLGTGKPADVKYPWPEMKTVIDWIHRACGVAVLAHPLKYELTRSRMCRLIADFAEAGGEGMEVISSQQLPSATADLVRIAAAQGLYASCGSDFHFPDQPWQELGNFGSLPADVNPVWRHPALRHNVRFFADAEPNLIKE
jgi:predicted metal-dependent phosphoesterase TrpH